MSFNPLEYFVGRKEEIELFNELLSSDQNPWVMTVDGLSGTGKSLLVDWLIKNGCANIPSARLTLASNANTHDLISIIAEQIHPNVSRDYEEGMKRIREVEERQSLVNYAPSLEMSAISKGSISGSEQSVGPVSVDMGGMAEMVKEERETRRLDLLVDTLSRYLKGQTWVLFVDEASYLEYPALERFFITKLFPRLRNRFPHFRLYLTGQSVPSKFDRRQRVEATLETFPQGDVRLLFEKAGITDQNLQQRVFSLTLGHPLLTSMLVEHFLELGDKSTMVGAIEVEGILEESERTEWIYTRILDVIPDPSLREIAANLSLFEWFDLSLLRVVFDYQISEKEFSDLVRRSFIKTLEGGKWRCHDIILKHLRPHRVSLLQDESRQIFRKIADALRERVAEEEDRSGIWNFRERINLTSSALVALLEVSLSEAEDYLLREIAEGLVMDIEYLYPLIRFIESRPMPDSIRAEVEHAKQNIEAMNLEQYSLENGIYLDRLGQHISEHGYIWMAVELKYTAALFFNAFDEVEKALAAAQNACEYENSLENRLLMVRVLTEAGRFDEAKDQLGKVEEEFGQHAGIQIERARQAFSEGEWDNGMQILFAAVSRYPQDVETREILMEILFENEQYDGVLAQAEAIMEIDPTHTKAGLIRMDALLYLNRYDELMEVVREGDLSIATAVDVLAPALAILNDPITRGRLLAELEVDPELVPPAVVNIMSFYFSQRGEVDTTDMLVKSLESHWPEAHPVGESYRAMARLKANRIDEALEVGEALLKQKGAVLDTYIIVAECYYMQGKLDESIQILEETIQQFPYSRDLIESLIAQKYMSNQQPDNALAYLNQVAEQRELEPFSLQALATVYEMLGRFDDAIEILEKLIFTTGRSELPIQNQLAVRGKYAILLAEKGERQKAADIAYSLLNLSHDPSLIAPQAAAIFLNLEDEDGLRAAFHSSDNWDVNDRSTFLGWLSSLILKRNASVEGLLAEFAAHPDRMEIVIAIDNLITQTNQLSLAPQIFQRIKEVSPGMFDAYIQMQQDTINQGGPAQIQQLEAAIAIEPENFQYHLALGRFYLAQGEFQKAKQTFAEAVRLNPGIEETVLQFQAVAFLEAGYLDMAQEILEPYLAILPPPLGLLDAVWLYLEAIGDREAELKLLDSAGEAYPHLKQVVVETKVDYDIEEGHFEEALEAIDQLRAKEQLEPGLAISRITALNRLERFEEALAAVEEELARPDISPLFESTLLSLKSLSLLASGNLDEAMSAVIQAIALDKNNAGLHFDLAELSLLKEDWTMAYESIMNGLALAPDQLPEYQEDLKDLLEKLE